jgi:hypothetical protein
MKVGLAAVGLILGLLCVSAVRADAEGSPEPPSVETFGSLAAEVERLVEWAKPPHWETRRSCLYHALAGQFLLAREGVPAALRFGSVVYAPGTVTAYRISPHAWLETATHLVDYSTLPRWGEVTVIPRDQAAPDVSRVSPGVTRVLALPWPADASLRGYLATHCSRFQGIVRHASVGQRRPGGIPAPRLPGRLRWGGGGEHWSNLGRPPRTWSSAGAWCGLPM